MLDVVPPELPDFVEHLVLDLVTRERLVGEVVVGRSFGLDDGGRGWKGGFCVGVGVVVKDVLDGLQWERERSERGQRCESEDVGRGRRKGGEGTVGLTSLALFFDQAIHTTAKGGEERQLIALPIWCGQRERG